MLRIGAHVSIDGGLVNTITRVGSPRCRIIQIFLGSPIRAGSRNVSQQSQQVREICVRVNMQIVIHSPYIVNLANEQMTWETSLISQELLIADRIGAIGCVLHVGKHKTSSVQTGTMNMIQNIRVFLQYMHSNSLRTFLIVETSAGQGTELLATRNNSMNELAAFYASFSEDEKRYLRLCIDTCHIFAAGYDIRRPDQVDIFFATFESLIGLRYIALIHLNDSQNACGSGVDRHTNIGAGHIGTAGLVRFIQLAAHYNIPVVLETPNAYEELSRL